METEMARVDEFLITEQPGAVARLVCNRPAARNSLSMATLDALFEAKAPAALRIGKEAFISNSKCRFPTPNNYAAAVMVLNIMEPNRIQKKAFKLLVSNVRPSGASSKLSFFHTRMP